MSTLSMAEERAQGVRARRDRHPTPPATTLCLEESVYVCNGDVGDRRFFDAQMFEESLYLPALVG